MATASILNSDIKCHDRGAVLIAGSFVLNGTGAVAASTVTGTGFTITRAAAGRFSVAWENEYASVLSAVATLEHTTEVDSKVCWDALSATGKTGELRLQSVASAVAYAAGTVTFDTKANTTTGDYFILNDGQRLYGFELNTTAATASHYITATAATGTITCGTKAQAANDGDYYILNDGQERYCFELDADGGGATLVLGGTTDYGNSITAVDISGDTTAADVAATLKTAIDSTSIQMTVTDNADGTLTLTNENAGAHGTTQQVEAVADAAYTITDMTGGNDADVIADVWTVIDVSGGTTAADLGTLAVAAINGTDIQITAADNDPADGEVVLTNDNLGTGGNTQQTLSETGSTLLALTDMTGGAQLGGMADADLSAGRVHFMVLFQKT